MLLNINDVFKGVHFKSFLLYQATLTFIKLFAYPLGTKHSDRAEDFSFYIFKNFCIIKLLQIANAIFQGMF